jgi:hypothetical protein
LTLLFSDVVVRVHASVLEDGNVALELLDLLQVEDESLGNLLNK